jgi:D-alanine-D-alanine ligase-like ATP-grasp enzyme
MNDFECPRCGHCCHVEEEHTNTLRQAAQRAVRVMDAHMMRADTDEFYEAKEALRQALEKNT